MLQLTDCGFVAQGRMAAQEGFPPSWQDMTQLEKAADEWIACWRACRADLARKRGGLESLFERLDAAIRTDKMEHLDDPDYPLKHKNGIVQAIHLLNLVGLHYSRFLMEIGPIIREIALEEGRPARVLELACGSGEFTLALGRLARKKRIQACFSGSDYISEYVELAGQKAAKKKIPTDFFVLNAFDMKDLEKNSFDIFFICQSTHHFTPGQVAKMIAQAKERGAKAFVSIDGRRSLLVLSGLLGFSLLGLRPGVLHDSILTGRKLYSEQELAIIAGIAAPGSPALVTNNLFTHSVLSVRFDLARIIHEKSYR
jgi:SAM-dependent methyltransferase